MPSSAEHRSVRAIAVTICVVLTLTVVSTASATQLFTANDSPTSLSSLKLNADGSLVPVSGSPFNIGTQQPKGLISSMDGRFLYSGHRTANVLGQRAVDGNGALSSIGPNINYPTGAPGHAAVTPNGKMLIVASTTNDTAARFFPIADDGTLSTGNTAAIDSNGGGLAISLDGRFLYACSSTAGMHAFSLDANSVATPLAGSPYGAIDCTDVAITPNGAMMVTVDSSAGIRTYTFGADGIPVYTSNTLSLGANPREIAMAPDGRAAYVLNIGSASVGGTVMAFSVSPAGALAQVGGAQQVTAANVFANGLALSPNGKYVAAAAPLATSNVFVFDTGFGTGLTPVPGSPFSSGANMGGASPEHTLAFQSNQGPSLGSATVAGTNRTREFTASGASDSNGSVNGYNWNFGDGTTATTGSASTTHVYAKNGNYTATVSALDDEGCSATDIYDGRRFLCNASANNSVTVAVDALPPTLSRLKLSKRAIRAGKTRTKLKLRVSENATIKIVFQKRTGRKYKGKKSLSFTVKAGNRSKQINGLIKKRKLAKGDYRLRITATDAARNTSSTKNLKLKIR